MENAHALVPYADIERMGEVIARSGLFKVKSPDQVVALMLVAQAYGMHPATVALDYEIIGGTPSKKPTAMMRDFQAAGGKIEWHKVDDDGADATFSHPASGSVRIGWDIQRAKDAGLWGKDNWKKYTRAMFRSRVVAEGVRTSFPGATSGMYTPEEVKDFENGDQLKHGPKVSGVSGQRQEYTQYSDTRIVAAIEETADAIGTASTTASITVAVDEALFAASIEEITSAPDMEHLKNVFMTIKTRPWSASQIETLVAVKDRCKAKFLDEERIAAEPSAQVALDHEPSEPAAVTDEQSKPMDHGLVPVIHKKKARPAV